MRTAAGFCVNSVVAVFAASAVDRGFGTTKGGATVKPPNVVGATNDALSVTIATVLPRAPPSSDRNCAPHAGFASRPRGPTPLPVIPNARRLPRQSGSAAMPTNGTPARVSTVAESPPSTSTGTTAKALLASCVTAAASAALAAPV
jgi:hypothetical protein